MAKTRAMKIAIMASDMYSKPLSRAERMFKSAGANIGRHIKRGAIVATAAIAALTFAMAKAVKAANEQEAAEKTLTTALGHRSKALLEQASALQKVTVFGDEAIIGAQALIGAFVKDEKQISAATKATLDLAAAKGMDLKAAADLVSKTLGSSTNAMSRYGIEVVGAVGSTERLESLTTNIAKVFGGQAKAQAETFRGKITQLSNAYGDLKEEIGFVISKNPVFIKAVGLLKTLFEDLSQRVKDNRKYLMELARSGIATLVSGVGKAVEVLRFFHNGWLGLKLVGNSVSLVLTEALETIFKGLRLVMKPLDLLFEGLKKIGAIKVNPFDRVEGAIGQFKLAVKDVGAEVLDDIERVNTRYDRWGNKIAGIEEGLRGINITIDEGTTAIQKETAAIVANTLAHEANLKARQNTFKPRTPATQTSGMGERGGGGRELPALPGGDQFGAAQELARLEAGGPPQFGNASELEMIKSGYEQKLFALQEYNAQVLIAMNAAGASQAEIDARYADLRMSYAEKERHFKITAAGQTFGALSNMMQNLLVATGGHSKKMFKATKVLAIGEATIKGYESAVSAWAQGMKIGGPPLAAAFMGVSIATTAAQIAKIKGQQFGAAGGGPAISSGGTASPEYKGGSYGSQPVPLRVDRESRKIDLTLNINNPLTDHIGNDVAEAIRDILEDGSSRGIEYNISVVSD